MTLLSGKSVRQEDAEDNAQIDATTTMLQCSSALPRIMSPFVPLQMFLTFWFCASHMIEMST